jgi:hypothetical protein
VKLTTHLHLVWRSRMCEAIPPLPQYASVAWYSVKKKQGQLYLTLRYLQSRHTNHLQVSFRFIKGKVVPVPRHNVLGEWWYSPTHSLTSALAGGEWSASRPGHFTAGEAAPSTHWIGGRAGHRSGRDTAVKRKIPTPTGNRTSIIRSSSP